MKLFLINLLFAVALCAVPVTVMAAPCPDGPLGAQCLENPIGKLEVTDIIGVVLKAALGVIGSLTLLMLVWGGFQWLTSAGNEEKIKKGTQTMVWAVIGVVLVFSSYLLVSTLFDKLSGK